MVNANISDRIICGVLSDGSEIHYGIVVVRFLEFLVLVMTNIHQYSSITTP
jgi:hypothetical protein